MQHREEGNAGGQATVDRELASITAAIEMVARGHAPAVTLAGLRLAETLLPEAQRLGRARHVRVRAEWPMGDGPIDLVIETEPEA
jgi:hypothetical protein